MGVKRLAFMIGLWVYSRAFSMFIDGIMSEDHTKIEDSRTIMTEQRIFLKEKYGWNVKNVFKRFLKAKCDTSEEYKLYSEILDSADKEQIKV